MQQIIVLSTTPRFMPSNCPSHNQELCACFAVENDAPWPSSFFMFSLSPARLSACAHNNTCKWRRPGTEVRCHPLSSLSLPLSLPVSSSHSYKYKMHAGPCDASCRVSAICGLERTRKDDPYACTDLPPGVTMEDVHRHQMKDIMC